MTTKTLALADGLTRRARLPEGEARILALIVEHYPDAIDRDVIGAKVGYKRTTRDLYLRHLRTRYLITDAGQGRVRAADELIT